MKRQPREVAHTAGIQTTLTFLTLALQCSYVVGDCFYGTGAGSFAFDNHNGTSHSSSSFRVVVVS